MLNAFNRILPLQLAKERRLHPTAKFLHCLMRFHPKATVANIATTMGVSPETARRHVKRLEKYDWMYSFRRNGSADVLYAPWMPLHVERTLADYTEWLYNNVSGRGERLMRFILALIVDDPHFIANARLQWIVSGMSGYRLEFDYTCPDANLAIEFQGRQHYEEVAFKHGTSNLQEQQQRDALKLLACWRQQFTLIEIADIELSPEILLTKLKPYVPLIPPRTERPLYQTLKKLCHGYTEWAIAQRGKNAKVN